MGKCTYRCLLQALHDMCQKCVAVRLRQNSASGRSSLRRAAPGVQWQQWTGHRTIRARWTCGQLAAVTQSRRLTRVVNSRATTRGCLPSRDPMQNVPGHQMKRVGCTNSSANSHGRHEGGHGVRVASVVIDGDRKEFDWRRFCGDRRHGRSGVRRCLDRGHGRATSPAVRGTWRIGRRRTRDGGQGSGREGASRGRDE